MGKRELLLIVGFVVVGTVVYQLTAPPSRPGDRGFSLSRIVDGLRREVRGNRASAETTIPATHPLAAGTTELRLTGPAESLTLTAEDRTDIASELHVWSNGFDDAEAQRLAKATALKIDDGAGSLSMYVSYPREARQRANLVLKIPLRLRVQVSRYSGRLSITNASDIELVESRGDVTVRGVKGRASINQRGGDLDVSDTGPLKLVARNTDARLTRIGGDLIIQTQAGEVRASELSGSVEVDANGTELSFEGLDKARGPIRVNAIGGTLTMRGVSTETRIDGRNTEIDLTIDKAAQVAVYNDGNDPIEVTPPRNGYHLDLLATSGGRISLPPGTITVTADESEQRASGAVHGGGPTITLRANHGNITIRPREAAEADASSSRASPRTPRKTER